MKLIQILLPLYDNNKQPIGKDVFSQVRTYLFEHFSGVTIYYNSPAQGLWDDEKGSMNTDLVITVEVMLEEVDTSWWLNYKTELEDQFKQKEILIRAFTVDIIS